MHFRPSRHDPEWESLDRRRDGAQRRFEEALARATAAELGALAFRQAMSSVREIHEELSGLDREARERGR